MKERVKILKVSQKNLNFFFYKNDDIRLENDYFNTVYSGLNVMVNNRNSKVIDNANLNLFKKEIQKMGHFHKMTGLKVLKIRENQFNFRKKLELKFKNLLNWKFSDIVQNMTELNKILASASSFEKQPRFNTKESLDEDAFIVECIDEFLESQI